MSTASLTVTLTQTADSNVEWHVLDLTLHEALDRPYELVCDIVTDDSMDAHTLLGCDVRLSLERPSVTRACCGIVARVEKGMSHRGRVEEGSTARIYVEPALHALRHTQDSRIFQNKSASEILETVLKDSLAPYGRDVELRLSASYPTREYCVQYMESTFDFVSRLMEEEGITYFFAHDDERELLVLSDANSAFTNIDHQGSGAIPFSTRTGVIGDAAEPIIELVSASQDGTTQSTVRDYDWTHPTLSLEHSEGGEDAHGRKRERYAFGTTIIGGFAEGRGYGEHDQTRRAELAQRAETAREQTCVGRSRVVGMLPGGRFTLQGHPQFSELDVEYAITRVTHRMRPDAADDECYENDFACIPNEIVYRPPPTRRKPEVRSTHIATVVGPAGEEIHTDEHGRIRVQFDWDREGQNDEHSSCFMRVMQPWAGQGWGYVWLPRIGMEVVVEFVNGDIDRPIVLNAVYDGAHVPPYLLPDEKTKSTIKSSSSLGDSGFNELRFEDKAGSEEIYVHAQRNLKERVENDHHTLVVNNQSNTVGVDQTEDVGVNQKLTVGANRTVHVTGAFDEKIDGGETRTVSSGVKETISGGETRTVSGGVTETINGGEMRTVTGALSETITSTHTRTTTGSFIETISGALTQTVQGGATIVTPQSYTITATGGFKMNITGGVTQVAIGGNTVLAPGGHDSIDVEYTGEGGSKAEAWIIKEASYVFNAAAEIIRVALGVWKIDVVGLKVTFGSVSIEQKPKDFAVGGAKVVIAGARVIKSKLFMNN